MPKRAATAIVHHHPEELFSLDALLDSTSVWLGEGDVVGRPEKVARVEEAQGLEIRLELAETPVGPPGTRLTVVLALPEAVVNTTLGTVTVQVE